MGAVVAVSDPGTAAPPHSTKNTLASARATGFVLSGMNSSPSSSLPSGSLGVEGPPPVGEGAGVGVSGVGSVMGVTVTGKGTVVTLPGSLVLLDEVGSSSVIVLQLTPTSTASRTGANLRSMCDSFT